VFFGRRRKALRRAVALAAVLVVQLWSMAPMAASVIYCIGDDGHAGFEMVRAGDTGCADCCHEPGESAGRIGAVPVSECTDIAISHADGATGKSSDSTASASFVAVELPPTIVAELVGANRARHFDPPRHSSVRLLQQTVLLI